MGRRRRAQGLIVAARGMDAPGWRSGPVEMPEHGLVVLPQTAPYDSRAEVPQPDGLVGRHRSRRLGSGTEFEGIRHFTAGDRLKRITWPVSLRTGELHVIGPAGDAKRLWSWLGRSAFAPTRAERRAALAS